MSRWKLRLIMLCIALPIGAHAGSLYELRCEDCGYEDRVSFGGGMLQGQVTGYCTTCKKFVQVDFERKGGAPEPEGTAWDSMTGRLLQLFTCPGCHKLFAEIPYAEALARCPRCGSEKVAKALKLLFD